MNLGVNLVAIHRKVLVETVVLTVLFQLTESTRHHGGVQQTNRSGGFAVLTQLTRGSLCSGGVGFFLYIRDTESIAGGGDVVRNIGRLEFLGRGIDLKALHQPRVSPTHQDRRKDHHAHTGSGNGPSLAESSDDKQHGHHQGNPHQDVFRRQHRVNIGIGGTAELVVSAHQQVKALQVITRRQYQRQNGQQHREVNPGATGHVFDGGREVALQVIARHHEQARGNEGIEHQGYQLLRHGQGKDKERCILGENRILCPE